MLPERWFCEMNVWDPRRASPATTEHDDASQRPRARASAPGPALAPKVEGAPVDAALEAAARSGGPRRGPRGRRAARARAGARPRPRAAAAAAPPDPPQWVQCDGCQKWRKIPAAVDTSRLPERWFCQLNHWDAARRSCEAPRAPSPATRAARARARRARGRAAPRHSARADDELGAGARRARAGAPGAASPARPSAAPPRGAAEAGAARGRGGAAAAAAKRAKPVWNWVQCEKRSCRKWRRIPMSMDPDSLPDTWTCNMNHWDQRFASCAAEEEDADDVEAEDDRPMAVGAAGRPGNKLSFRELIFNAEGKFRPPFSERSTVTSIFAIGTTVTNGKVRDVEAYHESSLYRDAHALFAPQPADKPPKRGPLD
ncbi:hypothetical protein SO694_00081185 [Aureococcus anophagefferens]|uniref:CW-type domain-containing protein n=1 Tax=Aureococcus anophagefferens TaxID=44056 RepID=A0ABR1G5A2_AURAN